MVKGEAVTIQEYTHTYRGKVLRLLATSWNEHHRHFKHKPSISDLKRDFNFYFGTDKPQAFIALSKRGELLGVAFGTLRKYQMKTRSRNLSDLFYYLFRTIAHSSSYYHYRIKLAWKNLFGKSTRSKLKKPKQYGRLQVVVAPKARSLGVGTKLLDRYVRHAKVNEVQVLLCMDTIAEGDIHTKAFWTHNGFHVRDLKVEEETDVCTKKSSKPHEVAVFTKRL
ncbi:MAG: GNAT family N-acetyltransferase [Candidatus Woesearchaeota archaeon]